MADKRRFFDVWIVDTNTVYQEVPYDVVADWLQQGRLLDDDKLKPSGTKDWLRVGDSPEFRPYSLAPPAAAPQDVAEALGHSEVELEQHKRHEEEEDDDVDMIPLIDVTLVLLIFFMIAATTAGAAALVPTPKARNAALSDDPNGVRIDIKPDTDGTPLYTVAEGNTPAAEADRDLRTLNAMLDRMEQILARRESRANLTINADKKIDGVLVRDLLMGLRRDKISSKLNENFFGVTEEKGP